MSHDTSPHIRRAQALARQQAAESKQAAVLLTEFVAAAVAQGIAPERLYARTYDGKSRYRTHTQGWYLKRDRTVAVGTDGEFYILSVPTSLTSLLRGAPLTPSAPPLVLGKGGRDGQSISLTEAIDNRLAAGNDWA